MKIKLKFKLIMTCLLAWAMVFLVIPYNENFNAKAFDYTQGIMFGQYYRLRNVATNHYLTMTSSDDADNVMCYLYKRNTPYSAQVFYLNTDYNTNSYYFCPLTSSSNRVLTVSSSGVIVLKTYSSLSSQKWIISRTPNGYGIKNMDTSEYIMPETSSYMSRITTGSFITNLSEWTLEPVYSGSASYFVTTNLSSDDSNTVDNIVNSISNMDYNCERVDLPVPARLRVRVPVNRMTVFHGHGAPGLIRLDQTDGNAPCLYSENPINDNYALDFFTQRNTYIMIISCHSGASNSSRCSLVQAAYNQGANCVTGFRDLVAGGEYYLEKVVSIAENNPNMSINNVMLTADEEYTAAQRAEASCPANTSNRITMGLSRVSINMD